MKVSSNQRAVILGIFIFLGIVILVMTILTLGSQKNTFASSVVVKSFFGNVNGLQKGNNVWFSGVKVGIIKAVILRENGGVEVDININEGSVQYIPKDSKARLSTDGLIGNKIIEIYGGTQGGPPLQAGDVLANDKYLSSDEMMSTLSKNNDNLLAITNDFKLVSSKIASGQGSIGKLLTDDAMYNELTATAGLLKRATENLERVSSNVSAFATKLNNSDGLANQLVTDTMVFSQLRNTVASLKNVAATSDTVINNLRTTTENLNSGVKNLNEGLSNKNTPLGLLLHDENAASNLKTTLKNLQSGSQKLDENLEALQHNFLLRGYFKKKARQEKDQGKIIFDTVVSQ